MMDLPPVFYPLFIVLVISLILYPIAIMTIMKMAIRTMHISTKSSCALAHVWRERFLDEPNDQTKSMMMLTIGIAVNIHLPIHPQVETCSSAWYSG